LDAPGVDASEKFTDPLPVLGWLPICVQVICEFVRNDGQNLGDIFT
jgi:hypothetical protein